MKKIALFVFLILFSFSGVASNNGFQYQAVVRDAVGTLHCNLKVDIRVTIYSGGSVSYVESHTVTTSSLGYLNITIGRGIPVTGSFSDVDWKKKNQRITVDVDCGHGLERISDSDLQSVPYSKVSDYALNSTSDDRCDSLATVMKKVQDDLVATVNNIAELKGKMFNIGVWGAPYAIKTNFKERVPKVTIDNVYGDGFIFYGTGKYKYYGSYEGYTVEMEKDASYAEYSGLSALLFNLEDNRFRFLHFTKFSDITENYLVIALFHNNNLDFSTTSLYVDGKYTNPLSLSGGASDASGCVLLTIGDSITTEGYYVGKLRSLLGCTTYYNTAVAGAWWGDKSSTKYDGHPSFNGADGNENNVMGNQIQNIINNISDFTITPDIILFAAGTNDANFLETDNDYDNIETYFTSGTQYLPLSKPTFDNSDTYMKSRQKITGAMRYCITKIQELFPSAKIYVSGPIQAAITFKQSYNKDIRGKQNLIKNVSERMSVTYIPVGEECGIYGQFETANANGRDLVDGLHPNESGGWKMAKYISNYIKRTYVK
ncbi:MAG: SGNH/GDSL hydrolase family protein [Bacteroidales bacterium]